MYDFIETPLFTKLANRWLPGDALHQLQLSLSADPRSGPVIPGTGGIRKLRWATPGHGKRGGLRIVYHVRHSDHVIWLLTLYPKNQRDALAPAVLHQIRRELDSD